ncbi:MAG: hypothetical protein Q6361_00615, partial [Candidatus Hermodarchaeota archaeon]|nr:hypothetical protein [Candidatus Hermodarchaeota archaeon]
LLALREATDAPVHLSVTAIYISPVLPCIDYQWFTIRYGLTSLGILSLLLTMFSTLHLDAILRDLTEYP